MLDMMEMVDRVDRVGMVDLVDVKVLLDSLATEVMANNVDWGKVNMGLTHWWKNVKKAMT